MNASAGSPMHPPGDHVLPSHITGPVGARRRRKNLSRLLVISMATLAVALTFGALQLTANLGYDEAAQELDRALNQTNNAQADVREAAVLLDSTTGAATRIMAQDSGALVDAPSMDALSAAVADAKSQTETTADLLATQPPSVTEKPIWFGSLFAAASEVTRDRDVAQQLTDQLIAEIPDLSSAEAAVTDAGVVVIIAAADAAPAFEAAHISARNDDIIALRTAAETAALTTVLDQKAVDAFALLQSAAATVITSDQKTLAAKAGPLLAAKLEVEAFARALAPGVLVEFQWNPIVNGVGYNGSMGGLTTWWWDEPDRAVIELSNSVAEQWPSARSKALVAHEVGHAISVKCEDMYDSSTQDSIENWATAWAISMGFTNDANGVWAYGYPPQSYIDAAAGCR